MKNPIQDELNNYYNILIENSIKGHINLNEKVLSSTLSILSKISNLKFRHEIHTGDIQNYTFQILSNSEIVYEKNQNEKGIYITYAIKILDCLTNIVNKVNKL